MICPYLTRLGVDTACRAKMLPYLDTTQLEFTIGLPMVAVETRVPGSRAQTWRRQFNHPAPTSGI